MAAASLQEKGGHGSLQSTSPFTPSSGLGAPPREMSLDSQPCPPPPLRPGRRLARGWGRGLPTCAHPFTRREPAGRPVPIQDGLGEHASHGCVKRSAMNIYAYTHGSWQTWGRKGGRGVGGPMGEKGHL